MLLLGVVTFCIAIPLCSNTVNAFHYTRLAVMIFIMSVQLTIGIINIGIEDISIYCSLVFQSDRTLFIDALLFTVGGICLITFNSESGNKESKRSFFTNSTVAGGDKANVTLAEKYKWESSCERYIVRYGNDEEGSVKSIGSVSGEGCSSSDSGINVEGGIIPKEYSLVVIFSVIGASIILSSNNLISIYLSTELQSFALYIIAALSRDSLRSVQASLKYFILGA